MVSLKLLAPLTALVISVAAAPTAQKPTSYSLKDIPTSKDLKWYPCYGGFTCARLEVPNDYENPKNGIVASIPLIRYEANKTLRDNGKPQMVLLNPGGPGGSGVALLLEFASKLSTILPQWDLISWDPRGIAFARPSANCVDDITAQANTFSESYVGSPGSTNASLYQTWAIAKAGSMVCNLTIGGEHGAGEFMSTSTVATDMISITDAWNKACGIQDEGLVNFIGYSYGTVIGQYFATMYPNRVGKFILDGVVDVDDYSSGAFDHDTITTDDAAYEFFKQCYESGSSELCTLYTDKGPDAIESLVIKFLDSLEKNPIAAVVQTSGQIFGGILTSDILKLSVGETLYTPSDTWMPLAEGIALAIAQQNATLLVALTTKPINASGGSTDWDVPAEHEEWFRGVTCSDIYPANTQGDAESYVGWYMSAIKQSFWGGGAITDNKLSCISWPFDGKGKYKGKFGAHTKSPILFIGNTLDPITPLVNAVGAQKKFGGSGLLRNTGPGHTSLNAYSDCIAEVYDAYMNYNQLPGNKICKAPNAFVTYAQKQNSTATDTQSGPGLPPPTSGGSDSELGASIDMASTGKFLAKLNSRRSR